MYRICGPALTPNPSTATLHEVTCGFGSDDVAFQLKGQGTWWFWPFTVVRVTRRLIAVFDGNLDALIAPTGTI